MNIRQEHWQKMVWIWKELSQILLKRILLWEEWFKQLRSQVIICYTHWLVVTPSLLLICNRYIPVLFFINYIIKYLNSNQLIIKCKIITYLTLVQILYIFFLLNCHTKNHSVRWLVSYCICLVSIKMTWDYTTLLSA